MPQKQDPAGAERQNQAIQPAAQQEDEPNPSEPSQPAAQQEDEPNPSEPKKKELKYTDDDVDGIIQSRLARERSKLEREIREKLEQEQKDAQSQAKKLENMTELERARYEAKQLRSEKEALEAERDLSQQMAIARRELSGVGINMGDELLSMFVNQDAEKTGEAISKIKELWPKAVNSAVQEKLKSSTPQATTGNSGHTSYGAAFARQYTKEKNGGKE